MKQTSESDDNESLHLADDGGMTHADIGELSAFHMMHSRRAIDAVVLLQARFNTLDIGSNAVFSFSERPSGAGANCPDYVP